MFLQIKIGNESLDLHTKTKAKFNYKNPAFGINQSTSLPFSIKKTPKNISLIGNVDRLDSVTSQDIENCSVWLGGVPFDYGKIRAKSASDESIEIYFVGEGNSFFDSISYLRINELVQNISLGTPDYNVQLDYVMLQGLYEVSVGDDVFQYNQQMTDTGSDVVNAIANLINATYPDLATPSGTTLILNSTDNHNINWLGFTYDAGNSYTYESSVLSLWQSFIDTLPTNIVLPMFRNLGLESSNKYINFYVTDYEYTNASFADEDNPVYDFSVAPFFLITSVLDAIETAKGMSFSGSLMSDADFINAFFHHHKINNITISQTLNDNFISVPNHDINTELFIPDLDAKEFLLTLLDFFCAFASYDYAIQSIALKPKSDLLNGTIEDWTQKSIVPYKSDIPKSEGYRISLMKDDNDGFAPTITKTKGDAVTPYDIKVAVTDAFGSTSGMPNTNQNINTELKLKFSKWIGLTTYPQANNFTIDQVFGFWEDWADFLDKARFIDKSFYLTINDLLKLRTFDEPLKLFRTKYGNATGLVSEFSFEADADGIGLVDVVIATLGEETDYNNTYYVYWDAFDNVSAIENNTGLQKDSATLDWDHKSVSVNTLDTDGWVESTVKVLGETRVLALSTKFAGFDPNDIDFQLLITNNNILRVFENGSSKGLFGSCTTDDKLKIERIGTTVYYKKNDVTFYTSAVASTNDLFVHIMLRSENSQMNEIVCDFD